MAINESIVSIPTFWEYLLQLRERDVSKSEGKS